MSRFVSGGTDEDPTQRDDAWLKAQQQLDAAAIAKQEAARAGGGKSLFETLQANKVLAADRGRFERFTAAKQEAFEESTKLTNQFRSLDEDEIEFLDSVQEAARAKELADKRATKEGLEEFRKQQEEVERAAKEQEGAVSPPTVSESWAVGPRKRKKGKEKDVIGGLKIRRTSTGEREKQVEGTPIPSTTKGVDQDTISSVARPSIEAKSNKQPAAAAPPASPPAPAAGLGLGAYSSSDED